MDTASSHPGVVPLVDRACRAFERMTGRAPEAAAAAPGRVNLIGEHTDYNDGLVLPMAIDRWCVAVGDVRATGTAPGRGHVFSDDLGKSAAYVADAPDPAGLEPWARYPVGAIWKVLEHAGAGAHRAIDMAVASSVPLGSGLSSSAAIEIATARLADHLLGLGLSAESLAAIGRAAEHEFAGVPCGIMDQLISACAVPGAALLIDCRTLARTAVAIPSGAAVVLADSGVRHALASGEYARRRASCERAARALGVAALRDADLDLLGRRAGALSEEDRACARHVITENSRVEEFVAAVGAGDLGRAGRLMNESHESLRVDYLVSCPELDGLVAAARSLPGVHGSRMTGGGFGGCTVTLCDRDAAGEVCRALEQVSRPPSARPMPPFAAAPVGGASAWKLPA